MLSRARYLMGTVLSVTVPAATGDEPIDAAFAEVARLEGILSNWRRTSEISRLNRSAARGPVRCSDDLFMAVAAAIRWAEETAGAFDPTVEPLVRALGLRRPEDRIPEEADGPAAEPGPHDLPSGRDGGWRSGPAGPGPVGYRLVRIDPAGRTVRYSRPGTGIDLGGIGKGIALDAAAGVLKRRGVASALLDFGGQLLAYGPGPDGDGWSVGIADPIDRRASVGSLRLRDASVATSGSRERAAPGRSGSVGHILDPRLGRAARFSGTVSVVARKATDADALSTALFVMGPEEGLGWAEERGTAALYLWRDEAGALERRMTQEFERLSADD
ncbi:MAG: FAD:protein FMN transferase [Acidobacteriota bacterium]